jgi:hypothetical protein
LQWLIGREKMQNDKGITNRGVLGQARSHVEKEYKIFGRFVCRLGFKNMFCVRNHMIDCLNQLSNQDVVMPKFVGWVYNSVYYILELWMEEFFFSQL